MKEKACMICDNDDNCDMIFYIYISIYLYRLNQSRFYNFGPTRNETDQTNDKVN